ncbi:hypothetical protein E1B28_009304 [Marasmius oreades]|uniref:Uncharacterized protein n=1 Tax=Marasmius oreades TaxID=181124 RepID=A0A9P7UTA0_9AGAR|nr:uncharacterized protein E1B28_009304 [Marasmius oreades]KAG7093005.1 hypothetical protein E1B28_009304 [Marasmius oreades]
MAPTCSLLSTKQRILQGSKQEQKLARSHSPTPLHAHSLSTQRVLSHAYFEKTRARMSGAVERFNTWAVDAGLKEGTVPSKKILVDYVVNTMAGHMASSTMKTHLRLLRVHWESKGWKWQGAQQLALCLKAVKHLVPPSSVCDRR